MSQHHCAKYWQLKSPNGEIIEGFNLNKLIKDNCFLFLDEDVTWILGGCKASKNLRKLIDKKKDGGFRRNTWKGWKLGDRMKNIILKGIKNET
jgi:hypothetical protein